MVNLTLTSLKETFYFETEGVVDSLYEQVKTFGKTEEKKN